MNVLPHMQIIDLKQMQQYYGTRVTLRGGHAWCMRRIGQGKESKNLNVIDMLPVQE
jgi:hypothetical protein